MDQNEIYMNKVYKRHNRNVNIQLLFFLLKEKRTYFTGIWYQVNSLLSNSMGVNGLAYFDTLRSLTSFHMGSMVLWQIFVLACIKKCPKESTSIQQ